MQSILWTSLRSQGRLSSDKTSEEIIAMAEQISKLKNKRFFDHRHRRIYEIESLDSFLRANNNSLNTDARYFSTLTDILGIRSLPGTIFRNKSFCSSPAGVCISYQRRLRMTILPHNSDQKFYNRKLRMSSLFTKSLLIYIWQNSASFSVYYIMMKGDVDYVSENHKIRG
jgi:hypothetical protein